MYGKTRRQIFMKTTHITIDIVIAQLVEKGGLDKVLKDSDNLAAVLDYIWEGQLPCLDSEICQKSALCYDKDIVLKDFIQKLNSVFENFSIKQ